MTSPDLVVAMNKACQFMATSREQHWYDVDHILCYLQGAIHLALVLKPYFELGLQGFIDIDWYTFPNNHRSTIRMIIFLSVNPIY